MAKKVTKEPHDKSTVRKYKHFQELRDCLASGWSVQSVIEYLVERYGEEGVPHERAIFRWRERHMPDTARVIPHRIIRERLRGVQFKVDVIGHLSRLVAICEDRVGRGIEQEDQFGGMPLAVNDGVIQVYLQSMAQYVKVAQDLGIMKSPPQVPLIDARTVHVTPEVLTSFRDTVREIKMIEQESIKQGLMHDRPERVKKSDKRNDQAAGDIQSS